MLPEIDATDIDLITYRGLHDNAAQTHHRYRVLAQTTQMDYTDTKETTMKCSIAGCPGEYEARFIVHTVRHLGKIMVIDQVPAEVCSICGDVLLTPDTVRQIETLLRSANRPKATVPLYAYA